MAHDLESGDGGASFPSVRETPWHQLGTVLPEAPTFADALNIARLDFDVILRPLFWKQDTPGDDFVERPIAASAVIREDTMQALGHVGAGYVPIQNRNAFRVLVPLLDEGLATIETAGVLRGGADCWMMVRFNEEKMGPAWRAFNQANGGDIVVPFGLIAANHTGRRGVLLKRTPVRVVCANTLGMAETGKADAAETVRHVGEAETRLVDAAQRMFANTVKSYEATATAFQSLRETIITEKQFEQAVLDVIAPMPVVGSRFDPSSRMAQTVMVRVVERRETLYRLWMEGTGQNGTPSAWAAYQATTEALDHNVDGGWPTRTERAGSLFNGPLAQAKARVLDSLLATAKTSGARGGNALGFLNVRW